MIYFVRHGETDWNKEQRVQGRVNIPLNEDGRAQAHNLKKVLKDHHFIKVYTSPLDRAKETAEIITSESIVDEFIVEDNLIEYDFGRRDGLTISDNNKLLEKDEKQGVIINYGEESDEDFLNRIAAFFVKTLDEEGNVLVVTHGAILGTLLRMLFPQFENEYFPLYNTSVFALDNKLDSETGNVEVSFKGINLEPNVLEGYLSDGD